MSAKPYTPTNLTGLDDLACAAYSSHAKTATQWAHLHEEDRDRWRSIVGYVLDIALPAGEHDQGPAMESIRGSAKGARQIAARQQLRAFERVVS